MTTTSHNNNDNKYILLYISIHVCVRVFMRLRAQLNELTRQRLKSQDDGGECYVTERGVEGCVEETL